MGTNKDFKLAVTDLTRAVIELTDGTEFHTAKTTTNNYNKFVDEVWKDGYITVSEEGCKYSIYDNEYVNIRARLFHDLVHFNYKLDFSLEDEIKVAKIQCELIETHLKDSIPRTRVDNACWLLFLDIVKQAEYYYKHKQFVVNQKDFIYQHFIKL